MGERPACSWISAMFVARPRSTCPKPKSIPTYPSATHAAMEAESFEYPPLTSQTLGTEFSADTVVSSLCISVDPRRWLQKAKDTRNAQAIFRATYAQRRTIYCYEQFYHMRGFVARGYTSADQRTEFLQLAEAGNRLFLIILNGSERTLATLGREARASWMTASDAQPCLPLDPSDFSVRRTG